VEVEILSATKRTLSASTHNTTNTSHYRGTAVHFIYCIYPKTRPKKGKFQENVVEKENIVQFAGRK
jgi:hypothetical protein